MADRAWIHAFTDGQDVSPHAAASDLAELPARRVATVCGRYHAMDRDQRWERTDRCLPRSAWAKARTAADPVDAVRAPAHGRHRRVRRAGRPRRTSAARSNTRGRLLQLPAGPGTAAVPEAREASLDLTTMTRYREDFSFPVAFEEQEVRSTLAEALSRAGARSCTRRRRRSTRT